MSMTAQSANGGTRHYKKPGGFELLRPKKELDPLTGRWVARGWPEERQRKVQPILDNWDQQQGDCPICDAPMRLHPKERFWFAEPEFCLVAKNEARLQAQAPTDPDH